MSTYIEVAPREVAADLLYIPPQHRIAHVAGWHDLLGEDALAAIEQAGRAEGWCLCVARLTDGILTYWRCTK